MKKLTQKILITEKERIKDRIDHPVKKALGRTNFLQNMLDRSPVPSRTSKQKIRDQVENNAAVSSFESLKKSNLEAQHFVEFKGLEIKPTVSSWGKTSRIDQGTKIHGHEEATKSGFIFCCFGIWTICQKLSILRMNCRMNCRMNK